MSELITPEEFIQSKEFIKALKDIDSGLKDLLKTIGTVSEATKKYHTEVGKGATTQNQLTENQKKANETTKQTISVEKDLQKELDRKARLEARLANLQTEKGKAIDKDINNTKKQIKAQQEANKVMSEEDIANKKRIGNIGKYKEDIVKAYVAIQATLMVAKAAFNAVNNAIQENETTAEWVERKIGGLGAAYDVLKSKLFGVVEGLIKSDESSIKWGNGLRNFLSALSMGFSELIPGVRNVGNEMNAAAKEAEKLIKVQQDLADLEGQRIYNRSVANKQLVEARDLASQEGIDNEQKKRYLTEAIDLEKKQTNEEVNYQTKIVANLIAQGELKKKLKTYDVGREGLAIKQAEAKLNDLITESLSKQRKAKAQLRTIDKEISDSQRGMYSDASGNIFKAINPMADWDKDTEEIEKKSQDSLNKMNADIQKFNDEKVKSEEDAQEKIDKEDEKRHKKYLDRKEIEKKAEEELRNIKIDALNAAAGLGFALGDRAISNLEEQKQKELDAAGDNARQKEKIERDYAKRIGAIKTKAAMADKSLSLLNIFISTRSAVMAIMAQLWVPFAIKTSQVTWTKILGGLQAAAVLAAPIPKFFKGVKDFKGGPATVGEKGFELIETKDGKSFLTPDKATDMLLPKGSTVHTHEKTIEKLKGMDNGVAEKLLHEQRLTRKAIEGRPIEHTNIDSKGLSKITQLANSSTRWAEIYFRH